MALTASDLTDLVLASRILAKEGVMDSFGHISTRDPDRADRFHLSRAHAPALVEHGDILEFDLDSAAVSPTRERLFAERVIHGCIYRVRPDVMAVCHHHAPAILPFCITQVPLEPVFHLGATMGDAIPVWDSQDEFGDTNLLVATEAQGVSLARRLGGDWTVLMRRHGATVVGRSVREVVFRSIYGARNAEIQSRAMALVTVTPLTAAERNAAGQFNLTPIALERAWEQWARSAGTLTP